MQFVLCSLCQYIFQIDDFKRLQDIAKQGKTIAIVGGGFLGSELACALGSFSKKKGGEVIQIFPEAGK